MLEQWKYSVIVDYNSGFLCSLDLKIWKHKELGYQLSVVA